MTSVVIMRALELVVLFASLLGAFGDTPANCTYDDVRGYWLLSESQLTEDCSNAGPVVNTLKVDLQFPNVAFDEFGNKGYWAIIYNQGFEVVINFRKYFAFSKYKQSGPTVTSYCNSTLPGWSHDILGNNWLCYSATKVVPSPPKVHIERQLIGLATNRTYILRKEHIRQINVNQSSWKAKAYIENHSISIADLIRRRGGLKSKIHGIPPPMPADREIRQEAENLPEEWDWRNVSGINYVSPVRNQGSCGSCYAFSSVGMIEARLRVATKNRTTVVLSPQDVVSCSKYAQGCNGGFPYLIAGKYGQDFGLTPEECDPYQGLDSKCKEKDCRRYFTAYFGYVGGFYGGCNEELMKLGLVHNGPMSVSFEVYDDFMSYSSGIYHHTGIADRENFGFNPFALTNHAVLLVGYGADKNTGEKYWTVKNSWGTGWGESGYFRIRRGTNECSIESIAVEAFPIP